jgi:hypothetical protein
MRSGDLVKFFVRHDRIEFINHGQNLDADKTKFAAGLVLLLVRDPRDVVI